MSQSLDRQVFAAPVEGDFWQEFADEFNAVAALVQGANQAAPNWGSAPFAGPAAADSAAN